MGWVQDKHEIHGKFSREKCYSVKCTSYLTKFYFLQCFPNLKEMIRNNVHLVIRLWELIV